VSPAKKTVRPSSLDRQVSRRRAEHEASELLRNRIDVVPGLGALRLVSRALVVAGLVRIRISHQPFALTRGPMRLARGVGALRRIRRSTLPAADGRAARLLAPPLGPCRSSSARTVRGVGDGRKLRASERAIASTAAREYC